MAPQIKESLMNMLGEFVGLKKSPDHKLSITSNQYLAEAVRQEIANNKFNSSYDFISKVKFIY